jgi:hypothetical protein
MHGTRRKKNGLQSDPTSVPVGKVTGNVLEQLARARLGLKYDMWHSVIQPCRSTEFQF